MVSASSPRASASGERCCSCSEPRRASWPLRSSVASCQPSRNPNLFSATQPAMTARMTATAIAASTRSRRRLARSASVRKFTYSLVHGEQVAACIRQRLASSPLILPKAIARIVSESGQPFRSGFGKSLSSTSLALLKKSSSSLLEADLSLREGPSSVG